MLPAVLAPLPWGVDRHLHDGLAASWPGPLVRPSAEGSYAGAVASVGAALEREGWPRAVVVGHSMASLVALGHALRDPGKTMALVLVGGCTGPSYVRDGLWQPGHPKHEPWLHALQRLHAGGEVRAYVGALLRLALHRDEAWPLLERDLAAATVDRDRMDAFFRAELPKLDLAPRLRTLGARALVLVGREDPLCTLRQSEALARALPQAELAVLPDCGHFPWYEQPDAFARALDGFLSRVP